MRAVLPPPNAGMGAILDALRRALIPVISQDQAAPRLLLSSPDGKTWEVTVDNSGVLSATAFTGTI